MRLFSSVRDPLVQRCDLCNVIRNFSAPEKKEIHETRLGVHATALIALVASVAFSILGVASCLGGIPFIGVSLLLISLPVAYFSYNVQKVCANGKEIIDSPGKYTNLWTGAMDEAKIHSRLSKDTFCFDPFISFAIASIGH